MKTFRHFFSPAPVLLSASLLLTSVLCGREFSLETIPGQLRSAHPGLVAARLAIEEARGRADQAGRWANPTVETEFMPATSLNEGSVTVGFSQQFPRADRLRHEKAAAQALVSAAESEVREQERVLIGQADALAVRWLGLIAQKPLLNDQVSVATNLASSSARAVAVGEGASLDAAQARLDAASAALALRRVDVDLADVSSRLKSLLGLNAEESLSLTGGLPPPLIPLVVADFTGRPDYQMVRHQWLSAQSDVQAERERQRQEPTLGFFASVDRSVDAPMGREDTFFAGVRVSLPVPFWDKREGFVREKRAQRDHLQASLFTVLHEASHEAAGARAEMTELSGLLTETDSRLLPLAEEQVKLAEAIYAKGQGELLAILRARSQLLQLRLSRQQTLQDFHLARLRFLTASAQR